MYSRLVIEGNAVYEIDEECEKEKQGFKGLGSRGIGPGKRENPALKGQEQRR